MADVRLDREPGELAIMLALPDDPVAAWPQSDRVGRPHISFALTEPVSEAQSLEAALMVSDEFGLRWYPEGRDLARGGYPKDGWGKVEIDGVAYFDKPDERVAYARVQVSDDVRRARDNVVARLQSLGLTVKRPDEWVPHATLAYLSPNETWTGTLGGIPLSVIEWPLAQVEIWRDDVRWLMPIDPVWAPVHKIKRDGERWSAWLDAGTVALGTFASEVEAREAIRVAWAEKLLGRRFDVDRTELEQDELRVRFESLVNMTPSELESWLDSPFAGPNRKKGPERDRARRVADRALRLISKKADDWEAADYDGAAQVVAFIERMTEVEQGEPLKVDGREGPSARDASLMDWGHDPRKDSAGKRSDAARGGWEWRTQGDSKVRPEHARLDGRQYAVNERDDAHGLPGEEYGCRCYAVIVPQRGTRREADAIERAARNARARAAQRWVRADKAPAVHTPSRVHVVTGVLRADQVALAEPEVLANGWRRYDIRYSRIGSQEYVFNGRRVVEYRDPSDVFATRSMDLGRGIPWELRHSADLLTPRTVLGVARGCTLTVERDSDGIHTRGISQAWDQGLFDAIDTGESRQVSVAFACDIDNRPGTDDYGKPFDRRQINIVWNSLASEPRGRAGSAEIMNRLDSAPIVHDQAGLLALAHAGTVRGPVFFDFKPRADACAPKPRKDKPAMHPDIMQALLAASGKSMAEIAAALQMAEADAAKLFSGEVEPTPEQVTAIKATLMAEREDAAEVTLDETLEASDLGKPWDGDAAKARIFAWATSADGTFDAAKAARLFLIGDKASDLKGDQQMPVADIVDGKPVIVGEAIRAALSRLGQDTPTGIAPEIRERAQVLAKGILDKINAKKDGYMDPMKPKQDEMPPGAPPVTQDVEMVVIDGVEYPVPPAVAAHVRKLEEMHAMASGRADSAETRIRDMLTRSDAEQLALDMADALELGKRAGGAEWSPERRKDAKGAEVPLSLDDVRIAACRQVFRADADVELAEAMRETGTTRSVLIRKSYNDAKRRFDKAATAAGADALVDEISKMRADSAAKKTTQTSNDPLAQGKAAAAEQARQVKTASAPA